MLLMMIIVLRILNIYSVPELARQLIFHMSSDLILMKAPEDVGIILVPLYK